MKLIVGLGNPGTRYAGTRHNVGFQVVDSLAERWGVSLSVEKFHGLFGDGTLAGERVVLLKPLTFMNRSGKTVLAAGRFYKLELPDVLIVVDELALPPGRLRMRADGSAGGHKGLQDIVDRLGTSQWCRLRVGIGEAAGDAADYVLSPFGPQEADFMRRVVQRASDAVECWVSQGVDLAMTRYNGDTPQT